MNLIKNNHQNAYVILAKKKRQNHPILVHNLAKNANATLKTHQRRRNSVNTAERRLVIERLLV